MKIWIDADACPRIVKEVIYKACARLKLEVYVVANSTISTPRSPTIFMIQVPKGDDQADLYIVEHLCLDDIVITSDIPLASSALEKGAFVIDPRGEVFTNENIRERLSMRNFMKDLRDSGLDVGGPPALTQKDKERFTNAFDRITTKLLKQKV